MESYINEIVQWVKGRTHQDISSFLRSLHPTERGYSARSVRRFCAIHGIHYCSGLTESEVDRIVSVAVRSVGNSYGRRTLHGLLRWRGVHVGQNRISMSLKRVAPAAMSRRQHLAHRLLNPHPYHASSFGEKLHIDQNEKLNRFGITFLQLMATVGKLLGWLQFPRRMLLPFTMPWCIHCWYLKECGSKWELTLARNFAYLQPCNDTLLTDYSKHDLFWKTTSTNNHRVERMWVEINQRVNYPVKRILVSMEGAQEIDMSNNVVKFCVSWTTMNVITPASIRFVGSWNNHRIPGKILLHLLDSWVYLPPMKLVLVATSHQNLLLEKIPLGLINT